MCIHIAIYLCISVLGKPEKICWRNEKQLHQLFKKYVRLRMRRCDALLRHQLHKFLYLRLFLHLQHSVHICSCALSLLSLAAACCCCCCWEHAINLCVSVCVCAAVRHVLGARLCLLLLLLLCKFTCFCLIRSKNRQNGSGESVVGRAITLCRWSWSTWKSGTLLRNHDSKI